MKVSPIGVNYQCKPKSKVQPQIMYQQPVFHGKHEATKVLGGLFGAVGTLGAICGTVIITGGVALPMVLGYGALSAGSGAVLGHILDSGDKDKKDK